MKNDLLSLTLCVFKCLERTLTLITGNLIQNSARCSAQDYTIHIHIQVKSVNVFIKILYKKKIEKNGQFTMGHLSGSLLDQQVCSA